MKNKISDLRNHMFAAIERLSNEDLSQEDIKKEIARSQAIADVGKVVVESVKIELLYAKMTNNPEAIPKRFLQIEEPEVINKIERPKAEYSNQSFN